MNVPLEEYLKNADRLAQDVINVWCINMQAGNGPLLSTEFKMVLDKTCEYRTAKSIADNQREFDALPEQKAAEERDTRIAFAKAYKEFWERHQNN